MMQSCEFCTNWAQWRLLWLGPPNTTQEFTTIYRQNGDEEKVPLVQRGRKLTDGPLLCGGHKEEMEKIPSELERSFRFIGAARLGRNAS